MTPEMSPVPQMQDVVKGLKQLLDQFSAECCCQEPVVVGEGRLGVRVCSGK